MNKQTNNKHINNKCINQSTNKQITPCLSHLLNALTLLVMEYRASYCSQVLEEI